MTLYLKLDQKNVAAAWAEESLQVKVRVAAQECEVKIRALVAALDLALKEGKIRFIGDCLNLSIFHWLM
jgi:hypothetical protein